MARGKIQAGYCCLLAISVLQVLGACLEPSTGELQIRHNQCAFPSTVGEATIHCSESARDLDASSDQHMTMDEQINSRAIGRVRPFLDHAATKQLGRTLAISRLDCYNCLLYGLPAETLRKLQNVQNACATLIGRARSRGHVTPRLFELHWLPIPARITYKILLLTNKALHGLSATYLADLLQPSFPRRQLRSARHEKLFEPFTRNGYGDCTFSRAAPRLWNKLPLDIRRLPTLGAFKARLNTHLFKVHYGR